MYVENNLCISGSSSFITQRGKKKQKQANKQTEKLILEQARLMGLDMAVGSVSEIDKMKYHKSIFQLC